MGQIDIVAPAKYGLDIVNVTVYFCDENGEYIKKAKLLSVEGKGTKTEEANHIPKGWGGEAELWLKCDHF